MTVEIPAWVHDAIFYQIFPDRFLRSGRVTAPGELEDWAAPPTYTGFKGGDLYGVAEKLDYLRDLGVTALYFCPVFSSASNHRYHTYDYFSVDPLLGGNAALKELLDQAHRRDMRVVLDGVFNHASRGFWQFHHVLENGEGSPYRDWFYFSPDRLSGEKPFQPYPADSAAEELARGVGSYEAIGYSAWWNLPALPKFNTACAAVREYLLSVAEYWIEFGIDGWRLDVPNEIDDDAFWREFRQRVRRRNPEAYIVGEVWGEAKRWLQGDMWDAVMNYRITSASIGFFSGDHLDLEESRKPGSFSELSALDAPAFAEKVHVTLDEYDPQIVQAQLNLLDSHDMPRFLTCCRGDIRSLQMAWLFLCTWPGAPCIYYGDEVGLEGRHDPDCRRGFPWDASTWNTELRSWYQACISLRAELPCMKTTQRQVLYAEGRTIVFLHQDSDSALISVFHADSAEAEINVSLPPEAQITGTIRLTADADLSVSQDELKLTFNVPGRTAAVIV